MNRKQLWLIGLCLAGILFIYPFPSTEFLYRNAEALKGRLSNLKGASFAVLIDPSFYYSFRIKPSDFEFAVSSLGLHETEEKDYYLNVMKKHGPLFWNFWWWRPSAGPLSKLYTGDRNGNNFYLLYDVHSHLAYLYIQNT